MLVLDNISRPAYKGTGMCGLLHELWRREGKRAYFTPARPQGPAPITATVLILRFSSRAVGDMLTVEASLGYKEFQVLDWRCPRGRRSGLGLVSIASEVGSRYIDAVGVAYTNTVQEEWISSLCVVRIAAADFKAVG